MGTEFRAESLYRAHAAGVFLYVRTLAGHETLSNDYHDGRCEEEAAPGRIAENSRRARGQRPVHGHHRSGRTPLPAAGGAFSRTRRSRAASASNGFISDFEIESSERAGPFDCAQDKQAPPLQG